MSETSLRRIGLVASRYRELQGLHTMSDAGFFVLGGLGMACDSNAKVLALCVGFAVYFGSSVTVLRRDYYVRRFGRIHGGRVNYPIFMTTFIGLQYVLILRDLHAPAWAGVTIVALSLVVRPLWVCVRDWPDRGHWLVPATAGAMVLAFVPTVVTSERAFLWTASTNLLVGVSLMVAGWFDHGLLTRTLCADGLRLESEHADTI